MGTQLKNRARKFCWGLYALSRGIVGSARVIDQLTSHFFLRGWCGLFFDPPECRFCHGPLMQAPVWPSGGWIWRTLPEVWFLWPLASKGPHVQTTGLRGFGRRRSLQDPQRRDGFRSGRVWCRVCVWEDFELLFHFQNFISKKYFEFCSQNVFQFF